MLNTGQSLTQQLIASHLAKQKELTSTASYLTPEAPSNGIARSADLLSTGSQNFLGGIKDSVDQGVATNNALNLRRADEAKSLSAFEAKSLEQQLTVEAARVQAENTAEQNRLNLVAQAERADARGLVSTDNNTSTIEGQNKRSQAEIDAKQNAAELLADTRFKSAGEVSKRRALEEERKATLKTENVKKAAGGLLGNVNPSQTKEIINNLGKYDLTVEDLPDVMKEFDTLFKSALGPDEKAQIAATKREVEAAHWYETTVNTPMANKINTFLRKNNFTEETMEALIAPSAPLQKGKIADIVAGLTVGEGTLLEGQDSDAIKIAGYMMDENNQQGIDPAMLSDVLTLSTNAAWFFDGDVISAKGKLKVQELMGKQGLGKGKIAADVRTAMSGYQVLKDEMTRNQTKFNEEFTADQTSKKIQRQNNKVRANTRNEPLQEDYASFKEGAFYKKAVVDYGPRQFTPEEIAVQNQENRNNLLAAQRKKVAKAEKVLANPSKRRVSKSVQRKRDAARKVIKDAQTAEELRQAKLELQTEEQNVIQQNAFDQRAAALSPQGRASQENITEAAKNKFIYDNLLLQRARTDRKRKEIPVR